MTVTFDLARLLSHKDKPTDYDIADVEMRGINYDDGDVSAFVPTSFTVLRIHTNGGWIVF